MDGANLQNQPLVKAGIIGGVAAVAAGLLQSGTSPLVPIFVGGTVFAITNIALSSIEKTQQAARKALKKAKVDKKGKDAKGKKSNKKEEEPEEVEEEQEEEVVETSKKGKKAAKKEEKKAAPKKEEAKKAPKAEEKKAPAKAGKQEAKAPAKQEAKAAATPKKGAKAEAKAATPAKQAAPAKTAPKAEAKKAVKAEAPAKKGAAKAEATPAPASGKKKKKAAPKVVEEPEEEDEEEEQDGWITQKSKPRKPSEKPAKVQQKHVEEDEEEEEKEEGPREESVTIKLPVKSHGAIFGEKGNTLAKIQLITGTRVKMPAKESKSDEITIRGSAEGIKRAEQILRDVSSQGYSVELNPNLIKVEITVPHEKQGGLVGKQGANIRDIQAKTDTKITVPQKESKSDIITIVGPLEGVKAAQAAIKTLVSTGISDLTHPDWIKRTVAIPRDQTALLIGPKGATIKAIQTSSSVKINIPENETEEQKRDPYQTITIVGPAPNVHAAERAILMCMQPIEDEVPDANSPWAGSMDYSEDAQWE